MAEHFEGKSFTVRFSNGATEDLFRIFLEQSEKLPRTESLEKTVNFIRERLNLGEGGRAFALSETNEDILIDLSNIIQLFANELSKQNPTFNSSQIGWDRDLRLSWLARLANLCFLIEENLKSKNLSTSSLQINLPIKDQITFERQKMLDIYHELRKKEDFSSKESIKMYQKIVDLSEKDSESVSESYLASIYLNYINLLNEKDDKVELEKVWKKFLVIAEKERDADGVNLAKESLLNFLEK